MLARLAYATERQIAAVLIELALAGATLIAAGRRLSRTTPHQ